MKFIETEIDNIHIIHAESFNDKRGFFNRKFCKNEFKVNDKKFEFVQVNHSFNKLKGTIRGMHFQHKPFEEIKLISCIYGSVIDVLIDVRKDSNTYLKKVYIDLNEKSNKSILVGKGIAHGFQTLENNTSLIYFHSEFFSENYSDGLNPMDPTLNINWPIKKHIISEKDSNYPLINKNEV